MATNVFYNIVREYAEALVKQRPDCVSGDDTAICAILTSKHDVFAGVTGISLNNGTVQYVPAEYLAINAMCGAGQTKARQMITLSLADFSVMRPDSDGVEMMLEADEENGKCEVFVAQSESVKASEFAGSVQPEKSEDFFSGFDGQGTVAESAGNSAFEKMGLVSDSQENEPVKKAPELGAPADFSSGFDIDVTNPFYEAPAVDKEVATISSSPSSSSVSSGAPTGNSVSENKTPAISKEELLKQAKKRKKIAKTIFGTRRK
ncbi:MAG: hypothetical protein NC340_07775 [Ruminococcus flavefaciens]|nr:hypothetical protein [Ruminococcus flavefaciens]MCM1229880.1 hypothetical protein [Ruminococcus flavefaciens]